MRTCDRPHLGGKCLILASVLACFSLATSYSRAATINYGDFMGTTVMYLDVSESSVTDALPLYGAPDIGANTLDFDPQGFGVFSTGGAAPDLTEGQLNFGIQSLGGNVITSLMFSEAGDFTLAGVGTSDTKVSVAGAFFVEILEVDGLTIDPLLIPANMTFTPNPSGSFELPTDAGTGVIWSGHLTLDLLDALTIAGISYDQGVTRLDVALNNTLVAQSETGSTALIAKKDFKGLSVTVFPVVPEPTSAALLLFGALLLAPRLRKR